MPKCALAITFFIFGFNLKKQNFTTQIMKFTAHAHTCECNQGKNLLPSSSHQSFCWIFWGLIFDWWWTWEVSRKKRSFEPMMPSYNGVKYILKPRPFEFFPALWLIVVKKVCWKHGYHSTDLVVCDWLKKVQGNIMYLICKTLILKAFYRLG